MPAAGSGRQICSAKMRNLITYWTLLAALAGYSVSITNAGQAVARPKVKQMNTTDFDRLFKTKDWTAVEIAQQSGVGIVPAIEPHLRDPDEVVRLLAVDCIAAAGGPRAPMLLLGALNDSNEQVRNNAVNALHRHLPVGHEEALIAAWDANRTRDAYVRQQIPMILGLMHAQQRVEDLKIRLKGDPRQEVRDGIIAGASKLGDPQSRGVFGEMLKVARGKRTAELIEFVKYLDEPWVIPLLVPALQRRDMAVDLSTHRHEVHRRDCDLAVDEVLRISKTQFSFPMNPMVQYREDQIAEVMRYAQTQHR